MTPGDRKEYRILILILVCLGAVLVLTTIRGPFIIDEVNYLVTAAGLRDGSLTVPWTRGLSPSKELFSFDPEAYGRIAVPPPVTSLAPPLYGPIALPFSLFGWRGLVLLNTIAFLLIIFLVFTFTRRLVVNRGSPWLAAAIVLFGGYSIEYAQGVWPHMLSAFLVLAGISVASKVWHGSAPVLAALSGLILGTAVGVREQDIVVLFFAGVTVLLFARKRIAAALWYAAGSAVPLFVIAAMNFSREHLWHPFPKFIAFSNQLTHSPEPRPLLEPLRMLWARFFDYSAQPAITYPFHTDIYKLDPSSGAYLVLGTVKKALVQSSPWVALAFLVLILVWLRWNGRGGEARKTLMALSVLVFPLIAVLSLSAAGRTDGLAFNQRYALELIPLLAIALALALDGFSLKPFHLVAGGLVGVMLYAIAMMLPSKTLFEIALLKLPLFLAALLLLAWLVAARDGSSKWIGVGLGACLGWALFVHVQNDLPASRARRIANAVRLSALEATIPDHSALFAYWGTRDAAGPLVLTKDVVILDAGADEGADAAHLTRELRGQSRRIFVLGDYFPLSILQGIAGEDSLGVARRKPLLIYEVIHRQQGG